MRSPGDRVFRNVATGAGLFVFVLMTAVAVLLALQGMPALRSQPSFWDFFTRQAWSPVTNNFGIAGAAAGTVIVSIQALLLGLPVAIASALAINEYAPPRVRPFLIAVVDLFAALPSLIYAFWGREYLMEYLRPVATWLHANLSFVPLFGSTQEEATKGFANSLFVGGVILALMIIPIVTSVAREVLAQVPRENCEAALALGGTRWGMIRDVILPFGRQGIYGAAMLGLGRALGETLVLALILSIDNSFTYHILNPTGSAIAPLIATNFSNADDLGRSALIAAGLVLFAMTLAVNLVAAFIVNRGQRDPGLAL